MTDKNGSEYFREPSKTPGDLEFHKAAHAMSSRFTRSPSPPVSEKAKQEKDELFRSFDEARLEAKKKVFSLTPDVLADYRTDLENDTKARRAFSWAIFLLVLAWLGTIAVIIICTGKKVLTLDASVLIALTVGATISIVGLLATVLGYFFTKKDEQIKVYDKLFEIMLDNEAQNRFSLPKNDRG